MDQSAEDSRRNDEGPSNPEAPQHIAFEGREPLVNRAESIIDALLELVKATLNAAEGLTDGVDRMLGDWGAHGLNDDSCYANGSASGPAARATMPGARRRPWRRGCRARWRR